MVTAFTQAESVFFGFYFFFVQKWVALMLNKWLEKLNRHDYPFIDLFYYLIVIVVFFLLVIISSIFFD